MTPRVALCTLLLLVHSVSASPALWSEGVCASKKQDGATRVYFNGATASPWANFLGDWTDAQGVQQGDTPYAVIAIPDKDMEQTIKADVTLVVKEWHTGAQPNQGLLVKPVTKGTVSIKSREYLPGGQGPALTITTTSQVYVLPATADTVLSASTYKCLGGYTELSTGGNILLYFDLNAQPIDGSVLKAELQLRTTHRQYGSVSLHVYRASPAYPTYRNGHQGDGLAAGYVNDFGVESDGLVYMAERFESPNFLHRFAGAEQSRQLELVGEEFREDGFEPLSGKALKVQINQGERTGLNLHYKFQDHYGAEPEEAFFRYYLRIGDGWQTLQGGKFPGLAGIYQGETYAGGWGGRRSNGDNGWSARTYFSTVVPENNPKAGTVPVGTYLYHGRMTDQYGEPQPWDGGEGLGILEKNRWYAVEQYVRLNTPGVSDGEIKAWIDGVPVMHETGILFRNGGKGFIKMESAWLDVYHGGTADSDRTLRVYIDNMVIAAKYVGPARLDPAHPPPAISNPPRISNPTPAALDVAAEIGDVLTFSAGVTDPDGDPLEVEWVHGGRVVLAHSREYVFKVGLVDDGLHVVELVVTDATGRVAKHAWRVRVSGAGIIKYDVAEDTYLYHGTYLPMGRSPELSSRGPMYFRFAADPAVDMAGIAYAKLVLYATHQEGDVNFGVYAAGTTWKEGVDKDTGATRDYADQATGERWVSRNGDYYDYEGVLKGPRPYALGYALDTNQAHFVTVDVTLVVKRQWAEGHVNLVVVSEGRSQTYLSKDAGDSYRAPRLVLIKSNGLPLPVVKAPLPVLHGDDLDALASKLLPGQWGVLETANYADDLMYVDIDGRKLHIAGWTDDAFWDEDLRTMMFMGFRIKSKFITLSGETGMWSSEVEPFPWPSPERRGHVYGHNAYNKAGKVFYHYPSYSKVVMAHSMAAPGAGWRALPELPVIFGKHGASLEYFEELETLVWMGADGIFKHRLGESGWEQLTGPLPVGSHSLMRYNPAKAEVLIMGGFNALRKVYKLGLDLVPRQLADSPIDMDIRADRLLINPATGHYVMISGRTMVDFDSTTETYTTISEYHSPFGTFEMPISATLMEKGVLLFSDQKTRLYKPLPVR